MLLEVVSQMAPLAEVAEVVVGVVGVCGVVAVVGMVVIHVRDGEHYPPEDIMLSFVALEHYPHLEDFLLLLCYQVLKLLNLFGFLFVFISYVQHEAQAQKHCFQWQEIRFLLLFFLCHIYSAF